MGCVLKILCLKPLDYNTSRPLVNWVANSLIIKKSIFTGRKLIATFQQIIIKKGIIIGYYSSKSILIFIVLDEFRILLESVRTRCGVARNRI
jgi:hypothetical protein